MKSINVKKEMSPPGSLFNALTPCLLASLCWCDRNSAAVVSRHHEHITQRNHHFLITSDAIKQEKRSRVIMLFHPSRLGTESRMANTRTAAKKKAPAAVETSASLEAQMQAFLDRGGKVEVIESGVSGQIIGHKPTKPSNPAAGN
ncbi:hypothetical protein Q4589_02135 [Cobetia marina]|jgi:hypothetical protein|uniref:hypothetical protein n=1 Tax=Cobetia TaxID=204286 RepID=UPI002100118C|nr:hypothetical protein [Cobetia marina]